MNVTLQNTESLKTGGRVYDLSNSSVFNQLYRDCDAVAESAWFMSYVDDRTQCVATVLFDTSKLTISSTIVLGASLHVSPQIGHFADTARSYKFHLLTYLRSFHENQNVPRVGYSGLGQDIDNCVPLSLSSIIWYQPRW